MSAKCNRKCDVQMTFVSGVVTIDAACVCAWAEFATALCNLLSFIGAATAVSEATAASMWRIVIMSSHACTWHCVLVSELY